MQEKLLNTKEAAEYLNVSVHTLIAWRNNKNGNPGPAFHRMGLKVRYKVADLEEWIESCRVEQGD
jgi:excisionase family DNA binding protein